MTQKQPIVLSVLDEAIGKKLEFSVRTFKRIAELKLELNDLIETHKRLTTETDVLIAVRDEWFEFKQEMKADE